MTYLALPWFIYELVDAYCYSSLHINDTPIAIFASLMAIFRCTVCLSHLLAIIFLNRYMALSISRIIQFSILFSSARVKWLCVKFGETTMQSIITKCEFGMISAFASLSNKPRPEDAPIQGIRGHSWATRGYKGLQGHHLQRPNWSPRWCLYKECNWYHCNHCNWYHGGDISGC